MAIDDGTITALKNLHDIAGSQFFPLAVLLTFVGHSGQSFVPECLLGLLNLHRILALSMEPLLEGFYREQVAGTGIRLWLFCQNVLAKIFRMVISVRTGPQIRNPSPVLLEVVKLQGVLDLLTSTMQLVTELLTSSLLFGRVAPSLLGTPFGLVAAAGKGLVVRPSPL